MIFCNMTVSLQERKLSNQWILSKIRSYTFEIYLELMFFRFGILKDFHNLCWFIAFPSNLAEYWTSKNQFRLYRCKSLLKKSTLNLHNDFFSFSILFLGDFFFFFFSVRKYLYKVRKSSISESSNILAKFPFGSAVEADTSKDFSFDNQINTSFVVLNSRRFYWQSDFSLGKNKHIGRIWTELPKKVVMYFLGFFFIIYIQLSEIANANSLWLRIQDLIAAFQSSAGDCCNLFSFGYCRQSSLPQKDMQNTSQESL